MTRRSDGTGMRPGLVVVAVAFGGLFALAASADAHSDPPGCSATGVSLEVRVFRSDGTTGVVGPVSQCEPIKYQVVLAKSSNTACAFSGGTLTLTLPQPSGGVPIVLSTPVPCIGGTIAPCNAAVQDFTSGLIDYTVALGDVVGGVITANANYTGGVAHDNDPDTAIPPVGASTPKANAVVLCTDNNACTNDFCDPTKVGAAACSHTDIPCTDNNLCTVDTCDSATGVCSSGAPLACNDNNACTTESCNPATGTCQTDTTKNCNDNNACTADSCNAQTGNCQNPDVVTPTCTDNNLCTNDVCNTQTGLCEFPSTGLVCTDNNVCTSESCDQTTGTCKTTSELNCEDNNLCTNDGCNPATGCSHAPVVCVDNNLCTQDGCVPATGCTFTDITAQCDDGRVCTDDRCDPEKGCVNTPSTAPECVGLNHFQCYEAKPFAFGRISGVTVQDRYGSAAPVIRTPHPFCLPSDKRGEDPTAATDPDHLFGYADPAGFARIANQTVTDQFGSVTVDLIRRSYLMVPTAKSLSGPTPPLAAPVTDHFQCYLVKRSSGAARFVAQRGIAAVDQFGSHAVDLLRPRYLCVPANKNNEDPTAPSHAEGLLCYKARHRARFGTTTAFTNNQFGPLQIALTRRLEFCVPSKVNSD